MMLTKIRGMLLLICLAIGFFSCDHSSNFIDEPQSVKVLEVEAETGFDLSSRSDWNFYVGGYPYTFNVDGSKIIATPANESSAFAFAVTLTDRTGQVMIRLVHKNYLGTRSTGPVIINMEDQSTLEKFLMYDLLCGDYRAEASETVKVTLFHENALLMFKTEGLPENAEVFVVQLYQQVVTPLRDKDDPTAYKAIVFPGNSAKNLYVAVKIDSEVYTAKFAPDFTRANISYPSNTIGHSAIVEFTLTFNDEKELAIEDVKRTSYAKDWPITQ